MSIVGFIIIKILQHIFQTSSKDLSEWGNFFVARSKQFIIVVFEIYIRVPWYRVLIKLLKYTFQYTQEKNYF
jgi:hypothetical protein